MARAHNRWARSAREPAGLVRCSNLMISNGCGIKVVLAG
jgi:hypothetical protein